MLNIHKFRCGYDLFTRFRSRRYLLIFNIKLRLTSQKRVYIHCNQRQLEIGKLVYSPFAPPCETRRVRSDRLASSCDASDGVGPGRFCAPSSGTSCWTWGRTPSLLRPVPSPWPSNITVLTRFSLPSLQIRQHVHDVGLSSEAHILGGAGWGVPSKS